MDYSEAADRISRKFAKAGQTPDVKKIEGKLRRLVDEFGVQPSEAERSVTNELSKEYNLPVPGSAGSPSGGKGGGTEEKKIADAVGYFVSQNPITTSGSPAPPPPKT